MKRQLEASLKSSDANLPTPTPLCRDGGQGVLVLKAMWENRLPWGDGKPQKTAKSPDGINEDAVRPASRHPLWARSCVQQCLNNAYYGMLFKSICVLTQIWTLLLSYLKLCCMLTLYLLHFFKVKENIKGFKYINQEPKECSSQRRYAGFQEL